jgi:arginine decarboxylase
MIINVTSGIGTGKTLLSSFDAALKDAGACNFNLIALSSVIPPKSVIKFRKIKAKLADWGNKLYVVKAEVRSRQSGMYIGAALGWYQMKDGRGVFVEHEEIAETMDAVKSTLEKEVYDSLHDLCKFRGFKVTDKKLKMKMCISKVMDQPTSALVIAVYESESWN